MHRRTFMITEFYVKGEDTGMANTSGAGGGAGELCRAWGVVVC